jgi:hypothetical protein
MVELLTVVGTQRTIDVYVAISYGWLGKLSLSLKRSADVFSGGS